MKAADDISYNDTGYIRLLAFRGIVLYGSSAVNAGNVIR